MKLMKRSETCPFVADVSCAWCASADGEAVRQYKEASGLDYRMPMFGIDDLAHEGHP